MTQLETALWLQNGVYPSYSDRTLITTLLSPGVVSGMAVTSVAGTLNLNVAAGTIVIQGTDQTRQGNYLCRSIDNTVIALDARPASGSRLDFVYARIVDTSAGVAGPDGWIIDKISGVPGASPVLPSLPSSSEPLAEVLVPAGTAAPTVTDVHRPSVRGGAEITARQGGYMPVGAYDPAKPIYTVAGRFYGTTNATGYLTITLDNSVVRPLPSACLMAVMAQPVVYSGSAPWGPVVWYADDSSLSLLSLRVFNVLGQAAASAAVELSLMIVYQ